MEIRPATGRDCRAIAELHVAVWQHAYRGLLPASYLASLSVTEREAMWRRMIERRPSQLLVARVGAEVIGFVAFGASRDQDAAPGQAEIWAVYVEATFWSTGAGRRLWLRALRHIEAQGYQTVSLWAMAGNERAQRFYERAGFVLEPRAHKSLELGGMVVEVFRYVRCVAQS